MSVGLLVVKPGLLATVQDLGRTGYRGWGVPVGGAFDARAHGLANALVGNRPDAATVEIALRGGVYEATTDLALALAGAPMEARILRGEGGGVIGLAVPCSFALRAGDRLLLGGTASGVRTYLATAGGWRTPLVLGSRSREEPLRPGDRLPAESATIPQRRLVMPDAEAAGEEPLRIIPGPDAKECAAAFEGLCRAAYRVSPQSDRMGLRLEGPELDLAEQADRLSAPVAPGAVQVAGGRPILLGVACGTMGGYPHVAHVISTDLPRLGQLRSGQSVRFRAVSLQDAYALDHQVRTQWRARLELVAVAARDGLVEVNAWA